MWDQKWCQVSILRAHNFANIWSMKVKFYSSYFQGQLFLRRVRREALIVFEHQGNEVNGDGLLHTSEPCVCVCVCLLCQTEECVPPHGSARQPKPRRCSRHIPASSAVKPKHSKHTQTLDSELGPNQRGCCQVSSGLTGWRGLTRMITGVFVFRSFTHDMQTGLDVLMKSLKYLHKRLLPVPWNRWRPTSREFSVAGLVLGTPL